MATSDLERMLDDWAMAWSSAENNDPEMVLALFADDCVFEDVTFGVVRESDYWDSATFMNQVGLLPSQ